ncbi:hypothetical protein TI39_contig60g00002 [Zymoseptoria brevis]|uniref:Uncharacterized protein n=1 Tax=Zymoseptoria brevis TaxID=1047168 RepID=A0A0F4GZ86_9PEZI|nr:hypothetical protein TI39_contig60g00002 [Zymoseptoria brevis]
MSFEAGHGPSPLRNEIKEPSTQKSDRPVKHSKRAPKSASHQRPTVNGKEPTAQTFSQTSSDKINNALGTTIPLLQTAKKQHSTQPFTDPPKTPTFLDLTLPSTSFSLPSTSPPSSTIPDKTLSHLSPTARFLQLSLRQQARREQARREQEQQSLYLDSSIRNNLSISDPRHHVPGLDIHQRRHAALVRKSMMSRAEEWDRKEEEEEMERRRRGELERSTSERSRSERRAAVLARRSADQVNPTKPPPSMRNSFDSLTSSIFRSPRHDSRPSKPWGEPLSEWDLGCGEIEKGEMDETSRWVEQLSRSLADCGVEGGVGGREGSVGEGEEGEKDCGNESGDEQVIGMSLEEALAEAMRETSGVVSGEQGQKEKAVATKKDSGKEVEEWIEVDDEVDLNDEWVEIEGE